MLLANGAPMKGMYCFSFLLLFAAITPMALAQEENPDHYCGIIRGYHYGPFDYLDRANRNHDLYIVEVAHFTRDVEKLTAKPLYIGSNLNYTLQAWPNHHRALASLAKFAIREKTAGRLPGMKYPVECYFERAIRWQAKDSTVRSIYGSYLSKVGRSSSAIEQLEIAVRIKPDNATAHYNLGLMYFDKANYDKARFHAERAYEFDFPLPGLRNKLIRIGKWKK